MPKITNSDRFPNAQFLDPKDWKQIGILNGIALFKIGTTDNEILVTQIAIGMGGDLKNVREVKALELSSLATHAASDLKLDRDKVTDADSNS